MTIAAFREAPHSDQAEQYVVKALRRENALAISLVALLQGAVVGHVALSPVTISDGSTDWFGLGPISVLPEHQQHGIGTQLMQRALAELRPRNAAGCVLLGDPAYYGRFGFQVDGRLRYPEAPAEYFQAIRFRDTAAQGRVTYHEAFNATGGG